VNLLPFTVNVNEFEKIPQMEGNTFSWSTILKVDEIISGMIIGF